jgi:hypothetical protein
VLLAFDRLRVPDLTRSGVKPLAGPAVTALAVLSMYALTRRTWPDAIYDFGSQLYYPWRMSLGQHLYTDIAYFNGPLSQWINTAAFRWFGVGLSTLVAVNLLILAAVALVLRRLTSTAGVLVFVLVFAFGQYVPIANYNWICPYTHEVTHGVALSLAAVLAARRPTAGRAAVAGLLLGGVFLTKAEVFAPAAIAVATGMVLAGTGRRRFWIAPAGALIPPVIAFAILALQSGRGIAVRGVLGSWPWIFDRRVAGLAFYRQGLGVDDIAGNAAKCAAWAAIELAAAGIVVAAGIGPRRWRSAAVVIAAAVAASILIWPETMQDAARPWPVLVAALAVFRLLRFTPTAKKIPFLASEARPGPVDRGRVMLTIFALGLMGKMLLNARVAQYGFALAMPAGVVLADAAVVTFPIRAASRSGDPTRARLAAGLLIAAAVAVHVYVTSRYANAATVEVGRGNDQFRADHRGVEVNTAIRQLNEIDPLGNTLAVFPQGLMLNYLTRRADPVSVVNLMPPEVISTGESAVMNMLRASSPDAIILSEKDIDDGGFVLTEGHHVYARQVLDWVKANYVRQTGVDPRSALKLTIWTRKTGSF